MNENGTKKREWVKNAAIIFLVILLLLTFFSNSIMNYSLPEVAAQYIQSGSITARIRGTGVVESGDPYNVQIKETRKVDSVEVRVGDTVGIGDVLCNLSGKESQELEAARASLEQAQQTFELALLTGDLSTNVMISAGSTLSMETYRDQIIDAKNAALAAEKEVETWQRRADTYSALLSGTLTVSSDTSAEVKEYNDARKELEDAQRVLSDARYWLDALDRQIQQERNTIEYGGLTVSGNDTASQQVINAQAALLNLIPQQLQASQAVAGAQSAVNSAQSRFDQAERIILQQQADVQATLTQKQTQLAERSERLTTLTSDIGAALNLGNLYDNIVDAQALVNELTENAIGSVVTAPIAGTITSVNVTSGLDTPGDGILFTMQPEGKGYTLSFTVTNEQARNVSVGDVAELVNSWRYDDVVVTLTSIKPDQMNPGQNKQLTFSVTGTSVVAGQSLSLSVGQRSSNYDMIVPNSAIREDNNGKFVLIVESRSTPIGTRYTATRVDVEVIASDDTQSAISGGLYGYEFVITTSTKPVQAGDLVRLAD